MAVAAVAGAAFGVAKNIFSSISNKKKYKAMAANSREKGRWEDKTRGKMVGSFHFNKQNIYQSGQSLLGTQETQIAGRGVSLSGETSYAIAQNTNKIVSRNVEATLRDRDWKIEVSQRTEEQHYQQAGEYDKAASQSWISGLLGAGASVVTNIAPEFAPGGTWGPPG